MTLLVKFLVTNAISVRANVVKKTAHLHLHHRVAQKASRLWCVRSFCCGALHNVKKNLLEEPEILLQERGNAQDKEHSQL